MKVIDLLNKIAKKEEVPKYIRFKDNNYIRDYDGIYNYYVKENSTDLLMEKITDTAYLNNEIEEDKKIEKLPMIEKDELYVEYLEINQTRRKINEIIDKLNNLEK